MSYSWQKIFNEFKRRYPEFCKYGTTYIPSDHMTIEVRTPDVGILEYNLTTNKIKFIERWTADSDRKYVLENTRNSMYEEFCETVKIYLEDNNMTQEQFSKLSGISRQSLIKYLRGERVPKISTMKQILNIITK